MQCTANGMRSSTLLWKSMRNVSNMSSRSRKVFQKTNSSFVISNNLGQTLYGDYEDSVRLNFAENFSRSIATDSIQEEVEDLNGLNDEIFVQLKSLIDDVIKIQDKPATSTLTVERKVRRVCDLFSDLSPKYRHKILCHLSENHDVDLQNVKSKAQQIVEKKSESSNYLQELEEMRLALTPPYAWLLTKIGQLEGGVKFLVDLRGSTIDLAKVLEPDDVKSRIALRGMNLQLKNLLSNWFSVGFLGIEQVTWASPCSMLQKVSEYEAVHPMRNWTDLKSRVGPYRRCFVYTHRSMPGEPIVVLHVALTTEISRTIASLVKHHRKVKKSESLDVETTPNFLLDQNKVEDPSLCTTGIFYSITSTQTGLQGIELGTFLIKQAVQRLKDEFPAMNQFSTLSPIPGFRSWLLKTLQRARKGEIEILSNDEKIEMAKHLNCDLEELLDQLADEIKRNQWIGDETLVALLEKPFMRLCAQYLYSEKRRKVALDSVANFHLRNGATLWRLNWLADLSPRGMSNSCGMMVNYRYFIENLEKNSSNYLEEHTVDADDSVLVLVAQAQKFK